MVKVGGGGQKFDDVSSMGSYMIKGSVREQKFDDMTSQGSYVVKVGDNKQLIDDISSENSMIVKGGDSNFDDQSSMNSSQFGGKSQLSSVM